MSDLDAKLLYVIQKYYKMLYKRELKITTNSSETFDVVFDSKEFASFSKLGEYFKYPNGGARAIKTPVIDYDRVNITDMDVILKKPNDKVIYTVDIVNDGDIDVEIESISLPYINDQQKKLLDFSAEYTSAQKNGSKVISIGDMLYSKQRKNVTITISYKDITDESLLPKDPIEVSLTYAINYVQSFRDNSIETTTASSPNVFYTTASANKLGDKINTNKYSTNLADVPSVYTKYITDNDNNVISVESCKKPTQNAQEICLHAANADEYNYNKTIISEYFTDENGNLSSSCSEDNNFGTMEFTCANSYVVLATDNAGGTFINDIENHRSCVINPQFGIYSCK